MSDRHFHLRIEASYQGEGNEIEELRVETFDGERWQELDLTVRSPGFLLFLNGLFSCQHRYMRVNSAECGLLLESAVGELRVRTGEDWDIRELHIHFSARLKAGMPSNEDLNYITERMHHCPVSTNLDQRIQPAIQVEFS